MTRTPEESAHLVDLVKNHRPEGVPYPTWCKLCGTSGPEMTYLTGLSNPKPQKKAARKRAVIRVERMPLPAKYNW